jgi:hypothetical protein
MDYDTKIELLEKISELKYVGSISDKFGEALERAQTVKILYNLRVCK